MDRAVSNKKSRCLQSSPILALDEVGAAVGCSESKVYRVLRQVHRRLEQLRDAAADETGPVLDNPT